MFEYVVAVLFVSATRSEYLAPPLVDTSIRYPVIARPPLSSGASHDRSIWLSLLAVAVRFPGAPGAVVTTDSFVTATLLNDAASFPFRSWTAFVSSPPVGSV